MEPRYSDGIQKQLDEASASLDQAIREGLTLEDSLRALALFESKAWITPKPHRSGETLTRWEQEFSSSYGIHLAHCARASASGLLLRYGPGLSNANWGELSNTRSPWAILIAREAPKEALAPLIRGWIKPALVRDDLETQFNPRSRSRFMDLALGTALARCQKDPEILGAFLSCYPELEGFPRECGNGENISAVIDCAAHLGAHPDDFETALREAQKLFESRARSRKFLGTFFSRVGGAEHHGFTRVNHVARRQGLTSTLSASWLACAGRYLDWAMGIDLADNPQSAPHSRLSEICCELAAVPGLEAKALRLARKWLPGARFDLRKHFQRSNGDSWIAFCSVVCRLKDPKDFPILPEASFGLAEACAWRGAFGQARELIRLGAGFDPETTLLLIETARQEALVNEKEVWPYMQGRPISAIFGACSSFCEEISLSQSAFDAGALRKVPTRSL